jgi:D-serine deaminase-like pyridoxal phosphate-dependent protein
MPGTPKTLNELITPAAVVDLDRMEANLDRMADYAATQNLHLRPHTKTHKSPELARAQLERGARGVTVATVREAHAMSAVADDILLAHPPVGEPKLAALFALPEHVRITVALDSRAALDALAAAAQRAGRTVGVLVELDLGMHRVGVTTAAQAIALAQRVTASDALEWRGLLFYPGHIREHVREQHESLARLSTELQRLLEAFHAEGLQPEVVSGGSTPTAFASHRIEGMTEIRPGTYLFNDRTTAAIGACVWEECAYTVLATVVSTAVAGQAVVDAGSKALAREEIRGAETPGFGALRQRPDVFVRALSEEHGILDLSRTAWRPSVGERVRIVPNHVCVSVNLQPHVFGVRGEGIERVWDVTARGWNV